MREMPTLENCHNIADLRRRAKSKLPSPMFHYLDGGSDDEWTLRRNTAAYDDYQLMPNYLRDVSSVSLATKALGTRLELPFFLAPTGMSRLFHRDKELGVARAAEKCGVLYSLSTMASTTLEEVATCTSSPKMFQIYIFRDRRLTREFVQRCKDSHYHALCLTVDTAIAGNRERDLYYGMTLPPKISRRNFFSYATSFQWLWQMLSNRDFRLANVEHRVDALQGGAVSLIRYVHEQFDPAITWDDVGWLVEQWDGPLYIKGLQSARDVRRARGMGVSGVMVSNHGGRQLEGTPAPVDCISELRDAVGDDLELIVDGGIRRGIHVLKALALGADACSIGRPYLYGLASGGERGVERAINILRSELERSLALLGCRSIDELGPEHVRHLRLVSSQPQ
jgi:L-lactate dehydrogenase (cytochrome)